VNFLAVEKNAFGKGRFSRIDVRANPDVSHFCDVCPHFVL
jgi:hypothetical protein